LSPKDPFWWVKQERRLTLPKVAIEKKLFSQTAKSEELCGAIESDGASQVMAGLL